MPYIARFGLNSPRSNPFPFDLQAVCFAKGIDLGAPFACFVGDNGMGKSTLLEVLSYPWQLPHIDDSWYAGRGCPEAAVVP